MITRASETLRVEGGATSERETNLILKVLTTKVKSGKRFRPFAGSVAYCPRQNWFFGNRGADDGYTQPTLTLYQGIGNGIEEKIVKGMAAHGTLLGTQVALPNPPGHFKVNVGGFIDAIGIGSTGKVTAYEIKTTGALPSSPKPNHLSQAMTYACLGGIDFVVIVYVGRQVQNFPDPTPLVKSFLINVQGLMLEYMTRIVQSCHSLTNPEAPMRPATYRKSFECQYCDFKEACWNEDVPTLSPRKSSYAQAEAEKTAGELIELRPTFYAQLLKNCRGSCPDVNGELLASLILQAERAAV